MAGLFGATSPYDTVKARKSALESFTNLVPSQQNTQKYERDKLAMDVADATGRQGGGVTGATGTQGLGTLGVLQKGAEAGANLLPKQGEATDKLNLQGANLQQDIANSKTTQATKNTISGMENETQRLARLVADNAFSAGMASKQLIFSKNNALSDYAMEAMKGDFQKGRISEKEIRDLTNTFSLEAQKKKNKAEQYLKTLNESFQADMEAGNIERAKSRILATLAAQKEALEAAAKAQSTATLIEGLAGVAAGILGKDSPLGGVISGLGNIFKGAAK
jgi:hypothetical protein